MSWDGAPDDVDDQQKPVGKHWLLRCVMAHYVDKRYVPLTTNCTRSNPSNGENAHCLQCWGILCVWMQNSITCSWNTLFETSSLYPLCATHCSPLAMKIVWCYTLVYLRQSMMTGDIPRLYTSTTKCHTRCTMAIPYRSIVSILQPVSSTAHARCIYISILICSVLVKVFKTVDCTAQQTRQP